MASDQAPGSAASHLRQYCLSMSICPKNSTLGLYGFSYPYLLIVLCLPPLIHFRKNERDLLSKNSLILSKISGGGLPLQSSHFLVHKLTRAFLESVEQ